MSVLFCSSPSTARSLVTKVAAHRQVLPFLYPLDPLRSSRPSKRKRHPQAVREMVSTTTPNFESWFINSLANAGNCNKHNLKPLHPTSFFSSRRPDLSARRRQMHNLTPRQHATKNLEPKNIVDEESQPNRTKEELMELVDQYNGESLTGQLPIPDLELPSLYQPSDGPNLTVSDKEEDEWPPPHYAWRASPETRKKLDRLELLLSEKNPDPDLAYQIYRDLPKPGVPYLNSGTRHKFLRCLYTVEKKDEQSMLRYLSVVDDMKNTAIPLRSTEWNSAISFVARYVHRSTEVEVEAALHMWRDMERSAGIKGTATTFNILFDVACKAGKFVLAEMIYKEMLTRGLEFDRFHHVSLIHYHALKRNGDGARAAYKALVEAGEIVDTIVLNAMIAALVSSYEANAAHNIYHRMKKMYWEQPEPKLAPRHYLEQREITRRLKEIALVTKTDLASRKLHQRNSIIAPNLHTYQILVRYYAVEAGELDKATRLLEEMKQFNIPIHGSLFLALLKGFAAHGGIRYTDWTSERLENVWKSCVSAAGNENLDVFLSKWMIVWALKAFSKCCGKKRALQAWEEVKVKWEPDEMELVFVMDHLTLLVKEPDKESNEDSKDREWLLGL
ncbi:hypothetical protein HYFRA_00001003 [Hymenoscyphus fraxineus]|uniref:Pentatricopeptide repeat protein n=1 Tax=Hymenoscyphus fraxineus TaxID=746836 RepID=A0A9N9KSN9_9HELO|nr:hypothetical protein HYFRA_00001003 [Hymenoscyphus fraxineus]